MGRLFNQGADVYFEPEEGFSIQLTENNLMAHVHRLEPLKDRVGIEDPRDRMWWHWVRYEQDPEVFDEMLSTAKLIGSVLMRDTPTQETELLFNNRVRFTDDDWARLEADCE